MAGTMKRVGDILLLSMLVCGAVVIYDMAKKDYRIHGYNAECARIYRETSDRVECRDRKLVHYRDHESVAEKAKP